MDALLPLIEKYVCFINRNLIYKFMFNFLIINRSEMKMAEIVALHELDLPEITPQNLSGKLVVVTGANVGMYVKSRG